MKQPRPPVYFCNIVCRDKTIKLWNTVGDCKFTYGPSPSGQAFPNSHSDWVSSVKFSPSADPLIVSAGWDAKVKVWQFTGQANQCKCVDAA